MHFLPCVHFEDFSVDDKMVILRRVDHKKAHDNRQTHVESQNSSFLQAIMVVRHLRMEVKSRSIEGMTPARSLEIAHR